MVAEPGARLGTAHNPGKVRRLRVVILTTPDAQPLDVAGPHEVFALAARKLHESGDTAERGYDVEIFTLGRSRHVTGASGLSLVATGLFPEITGEIDTLLVVGGMYPWNPEGQDAVLGWLKIRAPQIRRVAGVCTGTFVLAEAELLNGRRATTHWYFCQQLASRYPEIVVDPEPIYIADGNVHTCAGVTAGMDLALSFVEQDFGSEIALRIARAYVMFLRRPGGQSQFSTPLSFRASAQSPMNLLQIWILDHLSERLSVNTLARHVNMSPRNFVRVFGREFHMTPGEYLDRVRVEAARKRLEETDETVEDVAKAVGLVTSSTMRRTFLRVLDVTPSDYRARFRVRPPGTASADQIR
jgi:transcriptional regulator GlxA family with amidase domain